MLNFLECVHHCRLGNYIVYCYGMCTDISKQSSNFIIKMDHIVAADSSERPVHVYNITDMLLNYFHRHSKWNVLHHVSKHFHFEKVKKQSVNCAYYTIVKKLHGTGYRASHYYGRGYLKQSLNAIHHFVCTTCEKLTWPEPQNQISNSKEPAKISPPPLATEWLFFDWGIWYALVCGCSVGCLCSRIIMPQDRYV